MLVRVHLSRHATCDYSLSLLVVATTSISLVVAGTSAVVVVLVLRTATILSLVLATLVVVLTVLTVSAHVAVVLHAGLSVLLAANGSVVKILHKVLLDFVETTLLTLLVELLSGHPELDGKSTGTERC